MTHSPMDTHRFPTRGRGGRRTAAALLLLISAALLAPTASAQLLFSLTPDTRIGSPGSTVTYTGILTNQSTTDTVFLNQLSGTTTSTAFTIDFFSFLNYAPVSLAPGAVYSGSIFDLNVAPTATANGGGTVTVQGGNTENAQLPVASADFFIVVTPAPPAVAVFAVGLCGAGAGTALRRRRRLRGGRSAS